MVSTPAIDRRGVAFVLFVVGLVGSWYVLAPDAFDAETLGPETYVLLGFLALLVVANVFRDARDSWLYRLLFGAFVVSFGVHNLSGPRVAYLTGYGFVVLGCAGVVYAVYRRVRPRRTRSGGG